MNHIKEVHSVQDAVAKGTVALKAFTPARRDSVLRSDNMDTCWMTALSLTIFHCLIQFPQRLSRQTLAFNLVRKMEDQLKRWNRADSSGSKDEKIWEGRESILFSDRKRRSVYRCTSTPLASCRAASRFIMHAILNQTDR